MDVIASFCAIVPAEVAPAIAPAQIRRVINDAEAVMREMPQVEMPPVHRFAEGLYAREITIPKGTLLIGMIHAHEHLNIVSKGDISVLTEDGVKRIKAPYTMVCRPGTKRVGYTHEETVWTTVHATQETDLEKLEAELIAPTFESLSPEIISKLKEG